VVGSTDKNSLGVLSVINPTNWEVGEPIKELTLRKPTMQGIYSVCNMEGNRLIAGTWNVTKEEGRIDVWDISTNPWSTLCTLSQTHHSTMENQVKVRGRSIYAVGVENTICKWTLI